MLNTPEPIKEKKTIKDISKENLNIDKILKGIKSLFEPDPIKKKKKLSKTKEKKILILTKYLIAKTFSF